jgi:hypothetical protein
MHLCPTRVDGAPVLFAHSVTLPMCRQRQREHYHKCFTCVHNVARGDSGRQAAAALAKLPEPARVSHAG